MKLPRRRRNGVTTGADPEARLDEPEQQLRAVLDRRPAAVEDRHEAQALLDHDEAWASERAKTDLEAFALGELDEDGLGRREVDRATTLDGRRAALERANGVVDALARKALDLLPKIESQKLSALEQAAAKREERRAPLREQLAELDRADAADRQRRARVKAELDGIREQLDAGHAAFLTGQRRQQGETDRAWFKNRPSARRAAAAQGHPIAAMLEQEQADYALKQRESAAASWAAAGGTDPNRYQD